MPALSNVEFRAADTAHYARDVKRSSDGDSLTWQSDGADVCLVIMGPFSRAADDLENEKKAILSVSGILLEKYKRNGRAQHSAGPYTVSIAAFSHGQTYKLAGIPACYSIYGCQLSDSELIVFVPTVPRRNTVEIRQGITVKVEEERKGRFIKKLTGRYRISFENSPRYYSEGALKYTLGYEYPITKRMLETGFTLPDDPKFEGESAGYDIIKEV